MLRATLLITCLLLGACATSYKVAPSTAPIATRVAEARTVAASGRDRVVAVEHTVQVSHEKATAVNISIEAARVSLATADYPGVEAHLIKALIANEIVLAQYAVMETDLAAARGAFDKVSSTLGSAEKEVLLLQAHIDRQTVASASDHEIATRCKSWLGLGAIFYGVERLLKAGIVGILIFAVVLIGVYVIGVYVGGPIGGYIIGVFRKGFVWVKTRK